VYSVWPYLSGKGTKNVANKRKNSPEKILKKVVRVKNPLSAKGVFHPDNLFLIFLCARTRNIIIEVIEISCLNFMTTNFTNY